MNLPQDSLDNANGQAAAAQNSVDLDAHRKLAAEFSEHAEWANAIREYRAVLEIAPQDDVTRLDLCTALIETNQLSEAEMELGKLMDLSLDESLWWDDIGDAYLAQGKIADAERAFKEALDLNPDRRETREKLKQLAPAELKYVPPTTGGALLKKMLPLALALVAISVLAGCVALALWIAPMFVQNSNMLMQQRIVLRAQRPLTKDELETSANIFRQRLSNVLDASVNIQTQAPDKILVRAPAALEIAPAIWENFGEGVMLEFIDAGKMPLEEGALVETSGPETVVATGTPVPPFASTSATGAQVYRTVLTGQDLLRVKLQFDQNTNAPMIGFTLTERGQNIFADYTTGHVGEYLAIALNKKIISSPIINSPITAGEGLIQGRFTVQEAQQLVMQLNAQPLPAEFRVESTNRIPSFFP